MEKNNPIIRNILSSIYKMRPEFEIISQAPSINEYFAPVFKWTPNENLFKYKKDFCSIIAQEAIGIYGNSNASLLHKQLNNNFVVNTGPHLSLPRTFDKISNANIPELNDANTAMFQDAILSIALNEQQNNPFAITLATGRTPFSNKLSANYLQISNKLYLKKEDQSEDKGEFYKISPRKYNKIPEIYSPPLNKDNITELQEWVSNIRKSKKRNYILLPKSEKDLLAQDLFRAEQIISIFEKNKDNFSHQIAEANSFLINNTLCETKTKILTLEAESIEQKFITNVLRDENSLTHQIFADKDTCKLFISEFSDIETGWKKDSTPFALLKENQGVVSISQEKYTGSFNPYCLADAIEDKKIIPKNVLQLWANMTEAGLLQMGGASQSRYSTQVRNKACEFLKEMGDNKKAQALESMPTDLLSFGLLWGINKEDNVISYKDALNGKQFFSEDLHNITKKSGYEAILTSSLVLYDLLNKINKKEDRLSAEDRLVIISSLNHIDKNINQPPKNTIIPQYLITTRSVEKLM